MDTETTTTTETTPTNGAATAPEAAREKGSRKRLTETDIANIKVLKTQGKTLKEIADVTGFSVGSIQKHTADPSAPKKARAPRAPKAAKPAATPAAAKSTLDTPTAVKAAMADLLFAGHPIAAIRGALASLNLGGF